MNFLLHPSYCPNIITFAVIAQHEVVWEVQGNYQKQTYRNRCYICTDQGKHMLNIPIRHVGGKNGRQRYKDVRLENSYPWQRQHWRTLETAYRTSPFFEFYEDDLAPLYEKEFEFLLDFNLETTSTLCKNLTIEMPEARTVAYEEKPARVRDTRFLIDAKARPLPFNLHYQQVFGDRHGFIENLSVLDLLFNQGPQAITNLQEFPLELPHG